MNIDEITSKCQGCLSNPNANAAAVGTPWDSQITLTTGVPVTKTCDHDFQFLRTENLYEGEARFAGKQDVFYCRRCLEYREVKR